MADIQPEINAFKSAVYGEDVRDAMVSLANKVNNESSSAYESSEQVPYLVKHADFMWYVEGLYTEPVGYTDGLYFKFSNSWVRTPVNKNIKYASIDYIPKVTSPDGVENCIHIPNNSVFCYDLDALTYAVVEYTSITPKYVILILESLGGIGGGEILPHYVNEQLNKIGTVLKPIESDVADLNFGLYGQDFKTIQQSVYSQILIEPYENLYHGGFEPGWYSDSNGTIKRGTDTEQSMLFGWTEVLAIDTNGLPDGSDSYIALISNIGYSTYPRIYRSFYDENMNFISRTYNTCSEYAFSYSDNPPVGVSFSKTSIPSGTAYIYLHVYLASGLQVSPKSELILLDSWAMDDRIVHPYTSTDYLARDLINKGVIEKTRNIADSVYGKYYFSRSNSTPGKRRADSGVYFGVKDYIPVKPDTDYTVSFHNITGTPTIYYAFYDDAFNAISVTDTMPGPSNTCHSPDGAAYMRTFIYGSDIGDTSDSGIQIEEGSVATPFTKPWTFVDSTARYMLANNILYPEYWHTAMTSAIRKIRDNMLTIGPNGDSFVFVTDTHWRNNAKNSPKLIQAILENTGCNMVVNGGDNIQGHLTTLTGAADEILDSVRSFVFPGYRCLGVYGNHDDNTNNNAEHPESYLNMANRYSVINQLYRYEDLVYGDDLTKGNFYYYDAKLKKIRYIMLDWGANATAQTEFITLAMTTLPSGYKAVVVIHGIYANSNDTEDGFVMERQYVVDAFEPYKSNVLFFIQGHAHHDGVKYPYDGDNTPVIITRNDSLANLENGGQHVRGTDTEQSFDVVSFDYSNNVVHITRVGEGEDREITL